MQPCRQQPSSSQYLTCFICEDICQMPRMCPNCSKTYCDQCLQQIHNHIRSECPSCSLSMGISEFLYPKIVINLANSIAERVKRQIRRSEDREICLNHELPLSYFCVQCNLPLCADCGMLTTKHTGHKFVSYRDIYQRVKRKIQAEFPRFERKLDKLEEKKNVLQGRIIKMQTQYRRFKKHFQQNWQTYIEKLETAAKVKYEIVIAKEIANAQRLQELQTLRDTIYQQMQLKTQLSLIYQANSLSESINALSSQQPNLVAIEVGLEQDDLVEIIPEYVTWQYTLVDFSTKNGIIYSEPKCVNGVQWRLKIYPKGNGLARQKYLSVFVQMSKGFTGQNKFQYRIELINQVHPSLTVRRQYCSTFQIGECWGYNQFQPLEHLAVKEYLVNDCLVFQVGIRNRTYRALVNQQLEYINLLKKQLNQKQRPQKSQLDSRSKRLRMKMKESKQKSSEREKCEQKRQIMLQSSTLQKIKQFIMRDNKQ